MPLDPEAIDILIRALKTGTADSASRVGPLLSEDVRAAGLFLSAEGAAAVVAAMSNGPVPVLGTADFGSASPIDDHDWVVIEGILPAGLPISGVRLLLRETDGRIRQIVQELVVAPPEIEDTVYVDDLLASFIDSAFERGSPFIVAYVDPYQTPRMSFRGTVQTYGADTIAMWIRDRHGGLLKAIEMNPHVALMGSDSTTRTHYEMVGRARAIHEPEKREQIFERSPEHERNADPAMRGVAVVIVLDEIRGGQIGAPVHRRRLQPVADG